MIDKTILESSFKIQCNCVSQFGIEYMRSNLVIKNQNMFNGSIKDNNAPYSVVELKKDIDLDYCEGYVAFINNIFDNMTEECKEILYNEYFTISKPNWWLSKYSKSTLYRLKRQALREFLIYVI